MLVAAQSVEAVKKPNVLGSGASAPVIDTSGDHLNGRMIKAEIKDQVIVRFQYQMIYLYAQLDIH